MATKKRKIGPAAKPVSQHHTLSRRQLAHLKQVRDGFNSLADLIQANVPQCRELSLAITNLEQAGMWAVKAFSILHGRPEK